MSFVWAFRYGSSLNLPLWKWQNKVVYFLKYVSINPLNDVIFMGFEI